MTSREFGGYLPLELDQKFEEHYKSDAEWNVVNLNSGRATFYFAASVGRYKRVFVPHFTCANTEDPFRNLGLEVQKYFLDSSLLPGKIQVNSDDLILWTNYFGNARGEEINEVCSRYSNLIIDNCHAFFTPPREGAFNCYSTRKFFGVPDGGYLVSKETVSTKDTKRDISVDKFSHLIEQIDCGTNEGYLEYLKNEAKLDTKYLLMSTLTRSILKTIDYEEIKKTRLRNFLAMHDALGDSNEFDINLHSKTHMYYPLKSRTRNLRENLLKSKIYTPFWWRHVLKEVPNTSIEFDLAVNTVHLPIDQRYNLSDIAAICRIVKGYL